MAKKRRRALMSNIWVQTVATVLGAVILWMLQQGLRSIQGDWFSSSLEWLSTLAHRVTTGWWITGGLGILALGVVVIRRMQKPTEVELDDAPRSQKKTPCQVDLSRLPMGTGRVLGRAGIVSDIRLAIADTEVSVYALTGLGGLGKTSIVRVLCDELADNAYDGLERIFAWSFDAGGSGDVGVDSVGEFWDAALSFWGYRGERLTESTEKARELTRLLQSRPSLLILDSFETIQRDDGSITDRSMIVLLEALRRDGTHRGLALLTSRRPLDALADSAGGVGFRSAEGESLRLPTEVAVQLLRSVGVKGRDEELAAAVTALRGHALTITLAGAALARDFGGDIARLQELTDDLGGEGQVSSLIAYYMRGWPDGSAERQLLVLMSLFTAPATPDELEHVAASTSSMSALREMPFHALAGALESMTVSGLVIRDGATYSLHPLARSFVSESFEKTDPPGYRQAHSVLCDQAFHRAPESVGTLADLAPLYAAVYHGCMAGRYSEMFDVYWERISAGNRFLNATQLGDRSGDVRVIASFFPGGISSGTNPELSHEALWWLLAKAAFDLSSMGRFHESIAPRKASLRIIEAAGCWGLAAYDRRRLVHVLICLGRLEEASREAQRSVEYAVRVRANPADSEHISFVTEPDVEVLWHKCVADQAYVRLLMGKVGSEEVEQALAADADGTLLYHRFLLGAAATDGVRSVERLAVRKLQQQIEGGSSTGIANAEIVVGLAYRRLGKLDEAEAMLRDAQLRHDRAGRTDELMRANVEIAALHFERWKVDGDKGRLLTALDVLDDLEQLADFSGAELLRADGSVVRVSVLMALGDLEKARTTLEALKAAVQRMGYRLHDSEIQALTNELRSE